MVGGGGARKRDQSMGSCVALNWRVNGKSCERKLGMEVALSILGKSG